MRKLSTVYVSVVVAPVVRKVKSEWMLKITDYADKLIEGLDGVDYIERVKVSQKNWIGRSTGCGGRFLSKGQRGQAPHIYNKMRYIIRSNLHGCFTRASNP